MRVFASVADISIVFVGFCMLSWTDVDLNTQITIKTETLLIIRLFNKLGAFFFLTIIFLKKRVL